MDEAHPIPIRSGGDRSDRQTDPAGLPARRPGLGLPARNAVVRAPLVDIHETEAGLLLEADVPGTSEHGLTIHVENNVLSLRARVESTVPADAKPLDQEYQPTDFERSFILSDEVDRAGISAELRDGVLRVWMPRADRGQMRVIQVRTDDR
jgi:HSP20 family molecular chaperone IbpA